MVTVILLFCLICHRLTHLSVDPRPSLCLLLWCFSVQSKLCLPLHILEERGLPQVAGTVSALLDLAPPRQSVSSTTTPPGTSVMI